MTCDEFSREFDILYNNITSNQAPSLNSYEKSVFLTQAQEAIVIDLYRGISNKPFDLTEETSSYLSPIIKDFVTITKGDIEDDDLVNSLAPLYNVTMMSAFESDAIQNCWFIVYESALVSYEGKSCNQNIMHEVVPTTYDTFLRKQRNPFKRPNKHRILRLNIGEPDGNINPRSLYLIHSKNSEIMSYHCTYIKRPRPIILEDLDVYGDYNLTINGESDKSECELGTGIHREILYKAVELAKAVWTSTIINSES